MEIGYGHLEQNIMENPNLGEERKKTWKDFEDIRRKLWGKYIEMVRKNPRLSNSTLSSAIGEVMCRDSNRSREENISQWKDVIVVYCEGGKSDTVRNELFNTLDHLTPPID